MDNLRFMGGNTWIAASAAVQASTNALVVTMKPKLLDLFCCAGGAARGYQQAGFHVTGIDIKHQPRYAGDVFICADALEYVAEFGWMFDAIHASPPCQFATELRRLHPNKKHHNWIPDTRKALQAIGKPYIIENVPGAPLINPTTLVGSMFGLMTMRPRLFETSFDLPFMLAPTPSAKHAKMGRLARPGEYMHIAGKGGYAGVKEQWAKAMEIDWMGVRELSQAIPPAYTKWLGERLMEVMTAKSVNVF